MINAKQFWDLKSHGSNNTVYREGLCCEWKGKVYVVCGVHHTQNSPARVLAGGWGRTWLCFLENDYQKVEFYVGTIDQRNFNRKTVKDKQYD